jgi:hypothetical protein
MNRGLDNKVHLYAAPKEDEKKLASKAGVKVAGTEMLSEVRKNDRRFRYRRDLNNPHVTGLTDV